MEGHSSRALAAVVFAMVPIGCSAEDAAEPSSSPSSAEVSAPVSPPTATAVPTVRLSVVQRLADDSFVYVEGARSFIEVVRVDGGVAARADKPFDVRVSLLATDLAPGRYRIESWQQPNQADGSAGSDRADQCNSDLDIQREVELVVVIKPGGGCTIAEGSAIETTTTAAAEQPVTESTATAERAALFEAVIRHLARFESSDWNEVVIVSALCTDVGEFPDEGTRACDDRLSADEQEALAASLGDLAPTVRFVEDVVSQFEVEWTGAEPHALFRLGTVQQTGIETRIGGEIACGGACGGGAVYILEETDDGWRVTGSIGGFTA